jgi:hypothetical protein
MWINKAAFRENNHRTDPIVRGQIAIDGEFYRNEWEKIKEVFIAMGLAQLGGERPKPDHPTHQEIVAAIQEDSTACDSGHTAQRKLFARYGITEESFYLC